MSADKKIMALGVEYISMRAKSFKRTVDLGESPIEQLFIAAMLVRGWEHADQHEWSEVNAWYKARFGGAADKHLYVFMKDDCLANCVVQLRTRLEGKPRIDFAFIQRPNQDILIAVELDGHDFHEKTKEQASRDKARERVLVDGGWRVVRYTGSDVYRDAIGVVGEVEALINKLVMGAS